MMGRVESHLNGRGLVYVVQGLEGSPVKVGFSRSHGARLAMLQVGNPHPLRVVTSAVGTMIDERKIHAALGPERMVGEWFAWLPRTERFVTHLRAHQNIGAALDAIQGTPDIPADWDLLLVAASRVVEVFNLKGPYRSVVNTAQVPFIERPASTGNRCSRYYGLGDMKRWLVANDIPHVVAGNIGGLIRARSDFAMPSPDRNPKSVLSQGLDD